MADATTAPGSEAPETTPSTPLPGTPPQAQPTPHPLTDAYQKARRSYALFAGLLIAWELVGLRLPEDGKISASVDITVLSPQAAPYVLIALLLYFAYRTWLEWNHCELPTDAHKLRFCRVDHRVAHSLGGAALVLYGFQRLAEIQVADTVESSGFDTASNAFGIPLVAAILWLMWRDPTMMEDRQRRRVRLAVTGAIGSMALWALLQFPGRFLSDPLWAAGGLTTGALVLVGVAADVERRRARWRALHAPD